MYYSAMSFSRDHTPQVYSGFIGFLHVNIHYIICFQCSHPHLNLLEQASLKQCVVGPNHAGFLLEVTSKDLLQSITFELYCLLDGGCDSKWHHISLYSAVFKK
jgi:hypothetical protein